MGLTTLVTIRLREAGPGEVAVSFAQIGWGEGPEWDAVYDYFAKAWDIVLNRFVSAHSGHFVPVS